VCDLKPLILWMTIDRHYALSEAFRALPWSRSKNKPSVGNYLDLIGDTRNHVFHNVLPFQKALHFIIPDTAIKGAELRMFSEFGSKTHGNELTFADREIADALLSFTRARRRSTPELFWEKNADVMDTTIKVLQATSEVLKTLYHA